MSPRLYIALAITFVVVFLSVLGAWVMRDVVRNNAAVIEIDGIDTSIPAGAPFEGLTEAMVGVGDDCLRVVVADTLLERNQGLRDAPVLGAYSGMLFVFGGDSDARFTMAGTPLRLDIGWYEADGTPVSRTTMEPCQFGDDVTCPEYEADDKYRYALETRGDQLPGGALHGCPT